MAVPNPRVWYPALGAGGWLAFMASRFAVPLAGPAGDGLTLAWLWPTPWRLFIVVLATAACLAVFFWVAGAWLKQNQADPKKAAGAWLPSAVLWLFPLLELSPLWRISPGPLALARLLAPYFGLLAALALLWLTRRAAVPPRPAPDCLNPPAPGLPRLLHSLAPALVFLAALALAALSGFGLEQKQADGPRAFGGDETSYLLMAHSLAVDKSLDLTKSVLLKESYLFEDPDIVVGGHGRRLRDGAWVSVHRPGLPLLLAPFHAWGLYLGKSVLKTDAVCLWLLFAWLAAEVFILCRYYTGQAAAALAGAGATVLTLPGVVFSNVFFPEVAGAAFMAACLRRILTGAAADWPGALAAGALAGYLAWFNERYIPVAMILALLFLWGRPWRKPRVLAAFFGPLLLSAGLMMASFQRMYGHPWPTTGVHVGRHFFNPDGVWQGLSGLLLDGAEGLLPLAPVWLLGIAGLGWLLRRDKLAGVSAICLAGFVYVTAGIFVSWHGGVGPAGRYWVAALPLLALGLSVGLAAGGLGFRVVALLAGLASAAQAAHFVLGLSPGDFYGHQAAANNGQLFPVFTWLLPSFVSPGRPPGPEGLKAFLWALPLVAAVFLLLKKPGANRREMGRGLALSMAGWLAGLCVLALLAGLAGPGARAYWGRVQQVAAWRALSGLGAGAVAWPGNRAPAVALALSLPPADFARPPAILNGRAVESPGLVNPGLIIWGQYLNLPKGRYRLLARLRCDAPPGQRAGWLDVAADLGRRRLTQRYFGPALPQQPLALDFKLDRPAAKVELRLGTTGRYHFTVYSMVLQRLLN